MDVRAKQRLSYQRPSLNLRLSLAVSPHVISTVGRNNLCSRASNKSMKGISKFYAALLTFAFGVIFTVTWFSCQTTSSQQVADDKVVEQTNVESNQAKEETKSENDEAGCLSAEYPKRKGKYIVSFGVINGKAIDIPKPEYPDAARAAKISGEVKVGVVIDEKGEVAWGRIETGHPLLQAAVRKVVCQARFKPQTLSGRPVAVRGLIVYKFMPS